MTRFLVYSSVIQLDLPFIRDESSLKDYFERVTGKPVFLTLTSNSTRILSLRVEEKGIYVRLQRIFLGAESEVIEEVAHFLRNGKGNTPLVRKFLSEMSDYLSRRYHKSTGIRIQGSNYNLQDIFDRINMEYFGGRLTCLITWGAKSTKRFVKKRTLGSYSRHANTIRINPILDRTSAPRYVLEFIVYHEMLHAELGIERKNGRRTVHSKEFRRRERLFSHYHKAMSWEKRNL
jgi:SprT-like family